MALPTVVGVGAVSAGVGAVTPALPSGIQENDILILFAESLGSDPAMTVSDWTAVPGGAIAGTTTRLSVFWKRAGSSESAPTTSDTGDHQIAGIMAVRGCVTRGNPFLTSRNSTTSGATKSGTAFTTFIDDVLVINAFVQGDDGFTTGQFSNWTNASLTNVTERFDAFTDEGNGGGFGVATGEKATAGSVSATTATFSQTTGGFQWTAALIPVDYDDRPIVRSVTSGSSTAAVSIAPPIGYQSGDLLVGFVETNNEAVTVSGYTEAGSSPASNAGTNPTRLTVFYKWAGGSEGNFTTSDSGDHQVASLIAIRNGKGSGNPFDVTASSTGGTGTSVTIPGATTTVGNTLVLAAASTTRDFAGDTTFSNWTNSDLTGLVEVVQLTGTVGTGGGVGVFGGFKTVSGAYGSTSVTQATAVEWTGWTGAIGGPLVLSAEPGALTLASEEVYFGRIFADEAALTLTGEDAALTVNVTMPADEGTVSLTGGDATGTLGYGITADAGALSLTQQPSIFDYAIKAPSRALTLTAVDPTIYAGSPARTVCSFTVELIPVGLTPTAPDDITEKLLRYSQRLRVTVGAVTTEVAIKSWSYTEQKGSVGGSLQFELADRSQRSLFASDPEIRFDFMVWDWQAEEWKYYPLLDTGRLRNSSYTIGSNGLAPNDTFTVVALSEMEDRLNTAPDANQVWYDPAVRQVSADEVVDLEDSEGNVIEGVAVGIANMTLHEIMERVYVDECGFDDYVTNIPDFPVALVEFRAGVPYANILAGIIGMFEPYYTSYKEDPESSDPPILIVSDGTVSPAPGVSPGRSVQLSNSRFLGLSRETFGNGTLALGAIEVEINDGQWVFQYIDRRTEVTTQVSGDFGRDESEYIERETTSHYIDFYDSRYGDRPFRSQLDKVEVETYRNGKLSGTLIERSVEEFTWQFGNLTDRFKSVDQLTPDVVDGEVTGYSLKTVSEEYERLRRKLHPHQPGRTFVDRKTIVQWGLVYVDTVNQQLGEDYVRDAVSVLRAGNAREDMETDYRKTRLIEETYVPHNDGTVSIRKTEFDYLADRLSFEEFRQDSGEIGNSAFIGEKKKFLVLPPGVSTVTGAVSTFTAGELPLDIALAVARRKLRLASVADRSFEVQPVAVDATLQRGTVFRGTGRSAEALGDFVVEGRTLTGGQDGYVMNIQARSIA